MQHGRDRHVEPAEREVPLADLLALVAKQPPIIYPTVAEEIRLREVARRLRLVYPRALQNANPDGLVT